MIVTGTCIGVQKVGGAVMFAVPVKAIKPESHATASIWFRYAGLDRNSLVTGDDYNLQVSIHDSPRQYEVVRIVR